MGLKRKNTQKRVKSELSQRDPSDLGRGSVLWVEVRSDGAWFGRARLSQKAGGESEARSEELLSEAKARSESRFGPKARSEGSAGKLRFGVKKREWQNRTDCSEQ